LSSGLLRRGFLKKGFSQLHWFGLAICEVVFVCVCCGNKDRAVFGWMDGMDGMDWRLGSMQVYKFIVFLFPLFFSLILGLCGFCVSRFP